MEQCLITGASRGIGRAISTKLAGKKVTLFLHGRDREALSESCRLAQKAGADAKPVVADLASPEGITDLLSQTGEGPLHVMVNNAGVAYVEPFEAITLERWQRTLAVNVTAPYLLTQKLLPRMPEGASIVNILSVAARVPISGWSSYCASKFALDGLMQSLREELRSRRIRVINIYPSATGTDLWDTVAGDWARDSMLMPHEVADAVAYALSQPASVLVDSISVGNLVGRL